MDIESEQIGKKLVALTIPSMIDYALQSAVSYADYIMVGQLGEGASAAIGLTTEISFLIRGVLIAVGIGIISYIAIAMGKGEKENGRKACVQSFLLSFLLGIILMCMSIGISPFLPKWMGADQSIRKIASDYFRISYYGMIGTSFNILLGSVLKGAGNMKTPMYVNVGMNLLNICFNLLFIYESRVIEIGGIHIFVWGAGLGTNGAALATSFANIIGGICMILAVWKNALLSPKGEKIAWDFSVLKKIFLVAYPVFLCRMVTSAGRIIFSSLIARLSTISFAAHSITFTAESAFYMPVIGAQSAVTTMSGNITGEENQRKLNLLTKISCILIGIVMFIVALFMLVFARNVLSFFTSNEKVIEIGRILFYIVAVNEPSFAISVVMEGIFNGMGDTKRTFLVSAMTLWFVRVLGTWIAIHVFHAGVVGAWICMALENAVRGIVLVTTYFVRYRMKP